MKTEKVKIKDIKTNPNNPRFIKDDKFNKLVKSIKELPQMLDIRPIVVNDEMVVLGGNMRLKACQKAGLKEVSIIKASELTEEQQQEFIIKDNVGFGSWDWDILANEWDAEQLDNWGLELWKEDAEIDYSILDDLDIGDSIENMTKGVKRAIMIEFDLDKYEVAYNLIKHFKDKGEDIGIMLINFLESQKKSN